MLGVAPSDGVLRRLDLYSVWNQNFVYASWYRGAPCLVSTVFLPMKLVLGDPVIDSDLDPGFSNPIFAFV